MGSAASANAQVEGASKEQLMEFYMSLSPDEQKKLKAGVVAIESNTGDAPEAIVDDEMEKKLKAAFDDIDKNKSGFIEANELKNVLTHMGAKLTDEEIECVFKAADINGDQRLDMGEYMALVSKAMK